MIFDHEKLHVYQVAIQFNGHVAKLAAGLRSPQRHIREQLLRAALSIPLNIAEGNGKRSSPDRRRFFDIARGSATECAAALDVLVVTSAYPQQKAEPLKVLLARIVSMLTRLIDLPSSTIREDELTYEPTSIPFDPV